MLKETMIDSYINWNYTVKIYSDWTKIREFEELPKPIYPESMDLKITNYCDAWCKFCHEKSTLEWKHWDLKKVLSYLILPRWVEIAIGWWNPLSHPESIEFVKELRNKWLVPNMTINAFHILKQKELVKEAQKYCYAIWISYSSILNKKNVDYIDKENVVIHLIAWVHKLSDIQKCIDMWFKKVLVLGYKIFGRWVDYYNINVAKWIIDWELNLAKYLWKLTVSFDNLAIKQLNVRKYFWDNWNEFYMWDDWKFTMYVDAVNDEYSVCSFSKKRHKTHWEIKDMFYFLQNNNEN